MEEKKLTGYASIDKPWLKYYSEEAINTPVPECTVYEYLWVSNKDYLDRVALRYFDKKITFGEMFENIEKAARAFTAIGVKKGDIIIMATVTTPETVYAFYALDRLGVIPNMVDPRTSAEGIREYIQEVDAKIVLTLDVAYPKIEKAIAGTNVEKVIVTSPADSLSTVKKVLFVGANKIKGQTYKFPNNCVRWEKFITNGCSSAIAEAPFEKDTCCVIVHTGGTTGFPKGVMLSNENINALVLQSILTGIDMQREHTWMDIMPPFIAYGIGMGLHLPLVIGMETILIPSFDAKRFDELLLKHKPVHMVGVPSYWGTIINSKKLAKKNLSFIIAPTVGGDAMDTTLETNSNDFLKKHGCNYPITKGYGMTEVSSGASGTLAENNEVGSVGVPFVHTIISAFDPETGKTFLQHSNGNSSEAHDPNAPAIITYTGGTTGGSKGVVLSNKAVIAVAQQYVDGESSLSRESTWAQVLPLFIAYGVTCSMLIPMAVGMPLIVRIPMSESIVDICKKFKPNHIMYGPAYWEAFADSEQDIDVSYLLAPISGGDTIHGVTEDKINKYLNDHGSKYPIMNGYGMTEVGAAVSVNMTGAYRARSIGIPFAHNIIAAFDVDTGEELPYGVDGELCIHTPSAMLGYINQPEETANIMRKHEDGLVWVHTGDLGHVDADGFVFISGRLKRFMLHISDGLQKKVFSLDIERVLLQHPAVKNCVVVPIDDPIHNQVPVAYILPKKDVDPNDELLVEIKQFCSEHIDQYHQPVKYSYLDKIPLTKVGKVDYRTLEKEAEAS